MDSKFIEIRKYYSSLLNKAERIIKPDCCVICKKEITSTAHSHTVPLFILENIAEEGYVCTNNFNNDVLDGVVVGKLGIKKASIFRYICDECEKKLFSNYEESSKIEELMDDLNRNKQISSTSLMKLSSIYLKCILKEIHTKLLIDKNVQKDILDTQIHEGHLDEHNQVEMTELTLRDYNNDLNYVLDIINNKRKNGFHVYYHKTFNYKLKIAVQDVVCIRTGLFGEKVNGVSNSDSNIKMKNLCFVIFPIGKKTHFLIFGRSDERDIYASFFKVFNAQTEINKLKAIQALLFSHTEEIYISPSLHSIMKNDNHLLKYAFNPVYLLF